MERIRNLPAGHPAKNTLWLQIVNAALRYAALLALLVVIFQFMALYMMVHPGQTKPALSLVIALSGVVGSVIGLKHNSGRRSTPKDPTKLLSKRELAVFEHLLGHESNKEICEAMFIEHSTLKSHINRVYRKLSVSSRKELHERFQRP